ncbi:DUF177 domain-containing protein [Sphingomonas daechungensis]|uniref:DUF177 domain-containing protein n=1 Tax=Sphingomonas daechungensis TaxID=1176646 RepID=A0ABX6T2I8_9SPHN|nr:DUF177 domain-containing protein [Sphingomonas daechungensis]QNP44092.1 DUF177 domain-containing protein [Sphingomonas daechungensis]
MTDDFAHRLPLNQIRDGERVDLSADESERAGVAERLGLRGLERLEAHAVLDRKGEIVRARGRLKASLCQSCVVTDEPVDARIDEAFDIYFLPEPAADGSEEEVELVEADCDVVFHDGSAIDLGSAIADTLALGLDPYPRSAGAEAALKEAGVLSEAEAGPFAALAKPKRSDS